MHLLFILFLLVPIIEITVLINVGGVIGIGWTVLLVVFTAVLGAWLVRSQGFSTLNSVRTQMAQGKVPAMEMAEGVAILVAGALLLTPGFVTDAIGFACLTPAIRRPLINKLIANGVFVAGGYSTHRGTRPGRSSDSVIEGEYRERKE